MTVRTLLLSATLALACASAARAQDCQLRLVNTVPLTMVDDGRRALAPVTINGTKTNLLVDTGGAITQISADAIKEMKLPVFESGLRMLDLYGHASQGSVKIDSFILGRLQARNTDFVVSTFGSATGDIPVVGLLAPDFMGRFDVEFDFANAKMNYLAPDHCPGKVVYWPAAALAVVPMKYVNQHIRIDVALNGHKFRAIVDTGAYGTTLTASEAKRIFGLTENSPDISDLRGAEGEKRFEKIFETLTFDGISIGNPHVTIIPDLIGKHDANNGYVTGSRVSRVDDPDASDPPMLIGMNILTKLRFVVAFSEEKIYMTPATPPVAPAK